MVILRVESGLFFANADWVRNQIMEAARREGVHAVILDASGVGFIDVTAVEMLDQLITRLRDEGVELRVARDIGPVRAVIRQARADPRLRAVYPNLEAAVDAAAGETWREVTTNR